MMEDWFVDVTLHNPEYPGLLPFIPVENLGEENESLIVGLTFISTIDGFDRGRLRGIVHLDGQGAVEQWVQAHPEITDAIRKKCVELTKESGEEIHDRADGEG